MNSKDAKTIRGLLILQGLLTSASIRFVSIRFIVARTFGKFYALLRAVALAAQKRAIEFSQSHIAYGFARRAGSSAAAKGVEIVILIIFLVIALYVAAYSLPGALTAIATTALTSVNTGVQSLFQNLVSIISVVALILLLVGVVRSSVSA